MNEKGAAAELDCGQVINWGNSLAAKEAATDGKGLIRDAARDAIHDQRGLPDLDVPPRTGVTTFPATACTTYGQGRSGIWRD